MTHNPMHQNQAPRHFIPQFAFHGNKLIDDTYIFGTEI